ncbi:MAG: MGMT family protein [Bacteroidetes bacterium]|nr:MGMT family protein [Bacteroidota bacterium]
MEAKESFFEMVYEVVRQIPPGRATSYGAIARFLGTGKSSRMVGWAMNGSHTIGAKIPAHRVVNRIGVLTGKAHFGPGDEMKNLLEAEGIVVQNDQIQDFNRVFWDPAAELRL